MKILFFLNHVTPAKMMKNHCCHPQTKNLNLDRIWSSRVFSLAIDMQGVEGMDDKISGAGAVIHAAFMYNILPT